MRKTENENFLTTITPKRKLFNLNFKETFSYKDLIFLFVKRNFAAKYKQTVLGPLWAIIQPLLTTVVFTVIFGNLAKLTTADIDGNFVLPAFLFYMAGNIFFSLFSSTVTSVSSTFITNRHILSKVYFPRLVMPISTALSNLITFIIQFVMLILFVLYFSLTGNYSIKLTYMVLLLPVCLISLIIMSLGFGIIISAVTTKYRDLMMLVAFGLQLWQYASPIAYGLKLVPQKYEFIYMLNPITPLITTFRYSVFGFGYFKVSYFVYSLVFSVFVFLLGVVLFNRIEKNFTDTI